MQFVEPTRRIKTLSNLSEWNRSKAYKDYLEFVMSLNSAIKGKKLTDECFVSESTERLIRLLEQLSVWIDEIPLCEQPQRFGNKSYREWFKRLETSSESMIRGLLPDCLKEAYVELKPYLINSFGNHTRIDYGTGHETSFTFFLCCLYKLNVLSDQDKLAIINKIFNRYLELCRKLQITYRMEPAGSQGVWGLDDFQFLSYLWGGAQLMDNTDNIKPDSIPLNTAAERYHLEYLLFACTKYIFKTKNGPFSEHSNVLWGISSVPRWEKVNSGLLKMYQVEVLSKFPIVQHFVFGNLMCIDKAE